MRIIYFNIWHGHELEGLLSFISSEKEGTDAFCFLETDPVLLIKLEDSLSLFNPVSRAGEINQDGIMESSTVFVNKKYQILNSKAIELYETSEKDTGGFLALEVALGNKNINIGCAHGKSRPGDKQDSPERLKQSQIIVDYYQGIVGPKIIGGDFNLDVTTESLKIIERAGYKNLIKDFNIQNTRNKLCWNQFPEEVAKHGKQYFADYCFVSEGVNVKDFKVPNLEISDHEPLILDFEV